jgi:hypothetical protein
VHANVEQASGVPATLGQNRLGDAIKCNDKRLERKKILEQQQQQQ